MSYRALIVDDSRSARMLLGRILEGFGLTVHAVESAEQALTWLQDSRPDVIFMDHLMPGMDGFAAVKVIKSNPQTETIPVLMYTSQEGELYLSQARALGALGVLPKTLKSTDVAEVLRQLNMLPASVALTSTQAAAASQGAKPATSTVTVDAPRDTSASSSTAQLAHRIAMELSAELPALRANLDTTLRFWRTVALALGVLATAGLGVMVYWQYQLHVELQALKLIASTSTAILPPSPTAVTHTSTATAAPSFSTLVATESVNYGEVPLAGARLERLRNLVTEQHNKPGPTVIKVVVFTADFCLTHAGATYEPAPDEWPITRCEVIGNPFGDALGVVQRQSAAFTGFINSINSGQDNVVIQVQDGGRGALMAYPERGEDVTAGHWNEAALRNQRVEFSIVTQP